MKNSQYTFYVLMGLASGLSIVKTGVLAAILSGGDFAVYAGVFASVAFVAEIVSFGLTQATFKKYPRYTAYGRYGDLLGDIIATCRQLALRYIALFAVSSPIAYHFYGGQGVIVVVSVASLAIGMNAFSLVSSLFRALGRLFDLGLSMVLRTTFALTCGIAFALVGGWRASFLSESLSSMLIGICLILTLYFYVERQFLTAGNGKESTHIHISNPADGILVFISFFFLTLPVSLDRLFVTKFGNLNAASTYAFVGIWLTAAYTLSGIYVQKYGPDVVTQLARDRHAKPLVALRKNALILALLLAIGTAITMSGLRLFGYESFWQKYSLSATVVAISSLAVGLQVTTIFDWTLIALDGERYLLAGTLILVGVFFGLFFLASWMAAGFEGYAFAIVAGRLCQIVWADRAIAALQRARTLSSSGANA